MLLLIEKIWIQKRKIVLNKIAFSEANFKERRLSQDSEEL